MPSVEIVGRRAAALYAGISVMFWFGRDAPPSLARTAMTKGLAVACMILAELGLVEMTAYHVSGGILIAVGLDIALAVAWLLPDRTAAHT